MRNGYRRALAPIAILVGMLLLLMVTAACNQPDSQAVDLLEDPKFGLAHLNDEFHTIKNTLADPKFGLAHLNDEFHTIKATLADPKFGLAHLNDEFHTIKATLADLSQRIEALERR